MEPKDQTASLGGRVARGASWIAAARLLANLLGFVSMIVVARLLAPEDFGLVAVAVTAMQLLQGISDIGVSQAVVRFRDAGRADLDTLFTLSAIRGVAIAALLALAAPFAAQFFNDPRLVAVFIAAGAYPLLSGLTNPRFFEFERAIDFSKEFVWLVGSKIASVIAAVAVAATVRNYWAVIAGLVALAATQLALSYAMRPHRPRLTLVSWRKVIGFSGWLAGVSFMAALNNKIDAFILARFVGPVGTGNFYYGFQLAELPTREFSTPVARAIYPGLSELQGETARMRAAFLKGVEALGAIGMPMSIGFAFVANDMIPLLLGAKWQGAIPLVEVLTPILGVQTLFLATQYYAMELGLTRL
ncbi:MAG: oligosaccharide flippase family protein, partial [Amphiplicatus sp.]